MTSRRASLLPLPQFESLDVPGATSVAAVSSIETECQDVLVIGANDGRVYIVSAVPKSAESTAKPAVGQTGGEIAAIVVARPLLLLQETLFVPLVVHRVQCLHAQITASSASSSVNGNLRLLHVIVVSVHPFSRAATVRVLRASLLQSNGLEGLWRDVSNASPSEGNIGGAPSECTAAATPRWEPVMELVHVVELSPAILPLTLLPVARHHPSTVSSQTTVFETAVVLSCSTMLSPNNPLSSTLDAANSGSSRTAGSASLVIPAPAAAVVSLRPRSSAPALLWPSTAAASSHDDTRFLSYGVCLAIRQAAPAPVLSFHTMPSRICPSTVIATLGCVDGSILVVGLRVSASDGTHQAPLVPAFGAAAYPNSPDPIADEVGLVWQAFILATVRGAGPITKIAPYEPRVRLSFPLPSALLSVLRSCVDTTLDENGMDATTVASRGAHCIVVDSSGKVLVLHLREEPSPDQKEYEAVAAEAALEGADIELDILELASNPKSDPVTPSIAPHRGAHGSCVIIHATVELLPDYVTLVEARPHSASSANVGNAALPTPSMQTPSASTQGISLQHFDGGSFGREDGRRDGVSANKSFGPAFVTPFPGVATRLQKFVNWVSNKNAVKPSSKLPPLSASRQPSDFGAHHRQTLAGGMACSSESQQTSSSLAGSAPLASSGPLAPRKGKDLMMPTTFGNSPGQLVPATIPIEQQPVPDGSKCSDTLHHGSATGVPHQTGALLGMGPISVSVADVDGDGVQELIVTTLGRFVAFYKLTTADGVIPSSPDPSESLFDCVEAVEMPTHLYDCRLLRLHKNAASQVWVLCGPSHVMVHHHVLIRNHVIARAQLLLQLLRERKDTSLDT